MADWLGWLEKLARSGGLASWLAAHPVHSAHPLCASCALYAPSVANLGNLLFTSTGAIGIPIGIVMLFALNPDFREFLVKLINFGGF